MYEHLLGRGYSVDNARERNSTTNIILRLPLIERIILCIIFLIFALGFLFLSLTTIPLLIVGKVKPFAGKFIMSGVCFLLSFCLIFKPYEDFPNSLHFNQKFFFLSYITSIIINCVLCIFCESYFLIILFLICQLLSSLLYSFFRFSWIRNFILIITHNL